MITLANIYSINFSRVRKRVDLARKQDRSDVITERVLDRDGEGLDAREGAVHQHRDERIAARVGAEDLMRGGAEDLVVVAVDEGAVEEEGLTALANVTGGVREVGVVFPGSGVEREDELGVGGINEVQAAEQLAVGVVGGSKAEEVGLVHQHRVLDVGGLLEGGEGSEVAALVVAVGGGDHFANEPKMQVGLVCRRHVLCGLDLVCFHVAFIDMRKKIRANLKIKKIHELSSFIFKHERQGVLQGVLQAHQGVLQAHQVQAGCKVANSPCYRCC